MKIISTLTVLGFVVACIYTELSSVLPNVVMGMLS